MLNHRHPWVVLSRLLLTIISMRSALTALSPLLDQVIQSFDLSSSEAGLLGTLPLLCFASLSFAGVAVVARAGLEKVLAGAALLLALGALTRGMGSSTALFAGTLLGGAGAAVTSALLPAIVRQEWKQIASAMAIYALLTTWGGGLASALSYPLAVLTPLGWRFSLAVWALPALLSAWLWIRSPAIGTQPSSSSTIPLARLLRSPLAWQVSLFYGLNILTFFIVIAWLPSYLHAAGYSVQWSGMALGIMQILAVPPGIFLASQAKTPRQQGLLAFLASAMMAAGFCGYAISPELSMMWTFFTGIGGGVCLSLSLQLVALRTTTAPALLALSALSQTIGYGVAAVGPFLFGLGHDLTGSWWLPFLCIAAISMLQGGFGLLASRDRTLERSLAHT